MTRDGRTSQRGLAGSGLRAVVARIQRTVVRRAIQADPIGPVDTATVGGRRAARVGARDLDPAPLVTSDRPDLIRDLREVLVLAEDKSDVVVVGPSEADDVQRDSDVDTLLLADQDRRGRNLSSPVRHPGVRITEVASPFPLAG